jgi:hypothetical protein
MLPSYVIIVRFIHLEELILAGSDLWSEHDYYLSYSEPDD